MLITLPTNAFDEISFSINSTDFLEIKFISFAL